MCASVSARAISSARAICIVPRHHTDSRHRLIKHRATRKAGHGESPIAVTFAINSYLQMRKSQTSTSRACTRIVVKPQSVRLLRSQPSTRATPKASPCSAWTAMGSFQVLASSPAEARALFLFAPQSSRSRSWRVLLRRQNDLPCHARPASITIIQRRVLTPVPPTCPTTYLASTHLITRQQHTM